MSDHPDWLTPFEQMWLPEGYVRFQSPANLSAESVEDIEAWFALLLRRLKRSTTKPPGEQKAIR